MAQQGYCDNCHQRIEWKGGVPLSAATCPRCILPLRRTARGPLQNVTYAKRQEILDADSYRRARERR